MSHCPYLFHKFVINYFFDYSVCYIQVTNCSIRVSRSFIGPSPLQLLYQLWLKYNIAIKPYYYWWTHAYCIETMTLHAPLTYLSSEKKTLRCQLYSTHYAAVRINNCSKRTSANQSSHYENYGRFPSWMEAIMCLPQNWHFSWRAKMNETQRRVLVSPWRMYCMYSGMAKAPLWLKQHWTVKKIKPVALAIVELCESEAIRQAVS